MAFSYIWDDPKNEDDLNDKNKEEIFFIGDETLHKIITYSRLWRKYFRIMTRIDNRATSKLSGRRGCKNPQLLN